ncbi:MAG: YdcF family protein [Pseudomonadota bacterium]
MDVGEVIFLVLQPSNSLALLFGLGLLVVLVRRRLGLVMLAAGALLYVGLGVLPVGQAMLRTLENQFPLMADIEAPDGIVILGGFHPPPNNISTRQISLNEHGERLTAAISLAARYPDARVIITDGGDPLSGAKLAHTILLDAGIDPDRIVVEDRSLSTWDNAVFTHDIVDPAADEHFILLTSGWHMPRSVASFRMAGWPEPIPYPVDLVHNYKPLWKTVNPSVSRGLTLLDLATREYMATLYYFVLGRIETLRPMPLET